MKHVMLICIVSFLAFATSCTSIDKPSAKARAKRVVLASGGGSWENVKRIGFTFNVENEGKLAMSAKHDWDVAGGTDTVAWNGKTVTVNLAEKNLEGDAKAAFQRWTNDSYWLLAPLKLLDPGVNLELREPQKIEGKEVQVLRVTFENVGLTPGDMYDLYIDPRTNLVASWDYMPTPEKKNHGTWENYKDFNGLKLATEHRMGGRRIYFTDVAVETAP